ncbi:hypothetical protein [Streptomyces sp. MMBL 11-3]|uniref:hypothetical protein n=1 Tax=Streptomyces sp. MMBL 11-3 TaxID=3382639 RepID=UPI0039B5446C
MIPENPEPAAERHMAVPGPSAANRFAIVTITPDGVRLEDNPYTLNESVESMNLPKSMSGYAPDLVQTLAIRGVVLGRLSTAMGRPLAPTQRDAAFDHVATKVLGIRRSERWREAISTALLGPWCDPLWQTGHLPITALGALKVETRALHHQLTPVWRRRTRRGRVLSLDAELGNGLSLYDLVAADVDLLAHTASGVFEDDRLNRVLRALTPAERAVVYAYAEGEGTTWTEAAAYAGATDPDAFGERIRRKTRRLATEQHRRATQARVTPSALAP